MTVKSSIEVVGIKDALRELNAIDKRLRRRITTEFKQIMQPAIEDARRLIPARAPMSGWERNWEPQKGRRPYKTEQTDSDILPWFGNDERKNLVAFVSGKAPKVTGTYTKNLATFGMRWKGRDAVLFDMTGDYRTPQGARMLRTLSSRYGAPSRVMWRAYQQAEPGIQAQVRDLVNRVMEYTNRKIRV